ncbi:unnamed protein product [Adineta steineri]|uniref:Uncharacterized protein n=1 Tax=Adineta steineri TaxID=433720 RepID=A0A813WKE2_9BILA|nr:unnamed protein product [Adineta steineri]CAF1390978.1 unnamed protein product [Adineta steineri]CAF1611010.1 unnamed protein product [Adineta steineri]
MIKSIILIIGILVLFITIDHCHAWNDTDSTENATLIIPPKPFVYYGRYHQRRVRREYSYNDNNITSDHETMATILSILPLDRIGAIIGQIIATGVKEMLNPNIGKKIVNVLENQAPSLVTSLFTNLYSTLRAPVRPVTSNTTIIINRNASKQLRNSSTSSLINTMRRMGTK